MGVERNPRYGREQRPGLEGKETPELEETEIPGRDRGWKGRSGEGQSASRVHAEIKGPAEDSGQGLEVAACGSRPGVSKSEVGVKSSLRSRASNPSLLT